MIKSFIKLFLVFFLINFHNQLVLSNEALIEAVREKDISEIQAILDSGVDPNSTYMIEALRVATSNCYIEGMKALLDADVINIYGRTLLMTVARRGCIEGTELLLNLGVDPNRKNRYGDTPLVSATLNGHSVVVRLLLNAGGDPNSVNCNERTPLMRATINSRIEIMKDLLAWGADPGFVNSGGRTAFIVAASVCNVESMELLLTHGADPSINKDDTLLMVIDRGCVRGMKLLLSLGIDFNIADKDNQTLLITSVEARMRARRTLRIAEMKRKALLGESKMSEDLLYYETPQINTEVHIEVMDLLLRAGADPDVVDQDDFTPLMSAAITSDIEMVRLLLAYDVDPGYTNWLGYSALRIANIHGDEEIARLIREALNVAR